MSLGGEISLWLMALAAAAIILSIDKQIRFGYHTDNSSGIEFLVVHFLLPLPNLSKSAKEWQVWSLDLISFAFLQLLCLMN